MIKKILFILVLLILSISSVVAFEVPSEFEPIEDMLHYNSYTYTNSYGDENSGQVIEVLTYDEYKDKYFNDFENYSYTANNDGTFDFFYFGENFHTGIGKNYDDLTVLFWNRNSGQSDDNLKDLINECDALNGV